MGPRRLNPDAYVFVGQYGAQWNHSNFRGRFWKEAVTRAHEADPTFPLDLRFYDLRHTFVSLSAADTPIHEVSRLVGHSSIAVTAEIYGHMFPTRIIETATGLGDARRVALTLA
ncbi:MAG: tyrosine-type recombinase/integrase [Acidimicrobiales bacterium]|nr:tyrosine-type recombinase/integrase [Acidimicrobiales bacterium]